MAIKHVYVFNKAEYEMEVSQSARKGFCNAQVLREIAQTRPRVRDFSTSFERVSGSP